MSAVEQRPRFKHAVPWSQEELATRLQTALGQPDASVVGHAVGHHFFLKLPKEQRHFWTPQLDLEFEDWPEGGTLVRGLIGPGPAVWTRFVFFYAFSGFVCLFGIITGMPQWLLGKTPVGLWVALIGVGMLLAVYLAAQSGKQIGASQTKILRDFWEELVQGEAIPVKGSYLPHSP